MILYRDPQRRKAAPPGCDGVADLHQREDAAGTLWGVGDGLLVGPQPERVWQDLVDGWQVCQVGHTDPQDMLRDLPWSSKRVVSDTAGRSWFCPQPLNADGGSKILCAIGPNWEQAPTPDQSKALAVSAWFRSQLDATESGLTPGLPLADAAQGTAFLLSLTHAVSVDTLRVLGLIDEALIASVAMVASGYKE